MFFFDRLSPMAMLSCAQLDAGVMEAITKGPAFGDGKMLHALSYSKKIQGHITPDDETQTRCVT
jgi:hypothetical protein